MQTVIETNDARFQQHWHTLLDNDPVQDPLYKSVWGAGDRKSDRASDFKDRSFLIVSENQPIFGCSVTIQMDGRGQKRLGYFGLDAYTHVNQASLSNPSNNFCPEAIRLLQQHIDQLLLQEQPETIDFFDPVSCGIMSPVTQVLLEKGALPTVHQVQLIDLKQSNEELLANVSDECRQDITLADNNINTSVLGNDAVEVFIETPESRQSGKLGWLNNYLEILSQGQGFLVQANVGRDILASALFVHSKRTCRHVYADLVQDHFAGLPEKALLHRVIWQGIIEGKARGCELFDFGCTQLDSTVCSQGLIVPADFGGVSHTRLKVSLSSTNPTLIH